MNVPVYNIDRKQTEEVHTPDVLFGTPWKPALVHQAIVTQQANNRQQTAKVKSRGEVRGGGKKPWKQKGTGRARHGSIRSPLWIGGGVTHGPTAERSFVKKINKKMKLVALCSLLSKRFSDGSLSVVAGLGGEAMSKTKDFSQKAKALRGDQEKKDATLLIVTASADTKAHLGSRNLSKVSCISAKSLNIVDLASPARVVVSKEAVPELVSHFIEKTKKEGQATA